MILTCPNCATRYLVDPHKLGSEGRQVRCGKCAHAWFQTPPSDMPKRVEPIPLNMGPRPIPPGSNLPAFPPRPRRRGAAAGWVALALVVVAVVIGLLVARERIMSAWPPSQRLYAALGMSPAQPAAGLELRNINSKRAVENGVQILVIEGQVANVSAEPRQVPMLRGALRDAQAHDIQQWTFSAKEGKLLPGEVASFSTTLKNPATQATGVSISFADGAKS
jgi:predicted Zn finger-like uncharacterized protein